MDLPSVGYEYESTFILSRQTEWLVPFPDFRLNFWILWVSLLYYNLKLWIMIVRSLLKMPERLWKIKTLKKLWNCARFVSVGWWFVPHVYHVSLLSLSQIVLKNEKGNYLALVLSAVSFQELGQADKALIAFVKATELQPSQITGIHGCQYRKCWKAISCLQTSIIQIDVIYL